jgi:hypothetical protein
MKNKKKEIFSDFEAQDMDKQLLDWLKNGVSAKDKENFEKTLLYNRRFREHFCEWIKAIREPSWALAHAKESRSKS